MTNGRKKYWSVSVALGICLSGAVNCAAADVQHPSHEASALQWRGMFEALVSRQQWDKVEAIDHIGWEHFRSSSWWTSPEFQQIWQHWKKEQSLKSWTLGNGQDGIWRLAEGKRTDRPSMGIRRERDGSWWIIWIKPQAAQGQPVPAWNCPADGCDIIITDAKGPMTLHVQTPTDQNSATTYSLGAPVSALPRWIDSEWMWSVAFPGQDQSIGFDVSYARTACHQSLLSCF